MAKTIGGYHLKDKKGLNHWGALLKAWRRAHEKYCRIMEGYDAAHWYTERPNVSILGAAAWRCGGIALQEFKTKKVQDKEHWVGRGDLWVCTDTDGKEEFIEAKHTFVSLSGAKDGLSAIRTTMDKATEAAKQARGAQRDVTALAVVFVSLYAPKTSIKKRKIEERVVEIDKLIKDFCKKLKSIPDYDALAWCFPKETRMLQNKKRSYYPGIAMLVKKI